MQEGVVSLRNHMWNSISRVGDGCERACVVCIYACVRERALVCGLLTPYARTPQPAPMWLCVCAPRESRSNEQSRVPYKCTSLQELSEGTCVVLYVSLVMFENCRSRASCTTRSDSASRADVAVCVCVRARERVAVSNHVCYTRPRVCTRLVSVYA